MKRDKWVHIKVSESERDSWSRLAEANGTTLADLIRQQLGAADMVHREPVKKRRAKRVDPAWIRELAKVGNNLNQIARWANTYKSSAEVMAVLRALLSVERQLSEIPIQPREKQGDSDAY
jgi:hypothetical protein